MRYFKSTVVIFIIFLPVILFAGQKILSPCFVLELQSIGFPTAEKDRAAWPIRDLVFYKGNLYLGHGDAVVNTGATDVMYYDPKSKDFISEFTVDDEAIYYYQLVNNTLMIPGVDATEDWSFGNIYILSDTGWVKHRTIPTGIHVNDLAWYYEQLFASTGSIANIGEDIEYALGGIFASTDTGRTWSLSYASPGDENSVYRIQNLIVYQNKLYAFPFAYSALTKENIPTKYHDALSKPYGANNEYLILSVDIFGDCDVLVFDKKTWQCQDIIPKDKLCYAARPFVFKEKLLIPVLTGEYIDYLNKNRQLVEQARTSIFSFDGQSTRELKFDYDRLSDVLVKDDTLYLLIEKDSLYYIAETENLKKWQYYLIPPKTKKPTSIEYLDGIFYIGSEDGNIFASSNKVLVKNFKEVEKIVPARFYGAAELPRDGKWYWTAMSEIENWGRLARITAEVKYGNVIKLKTSNISKISVFPPLYLLDPQHETMLIINDQVVFEGFVEDISELICTQSLSDDTIAWKVEKGYATFETYTPEKYLIGNTEIELLRSDANSLVGYWKADAIKYAAGTDLGVINYEGIRADIITSNVYLEDIYDAHYRNTLRKFEASGRDLIAMLEYNLNQPEDMRCNISGFTVKYVSDDSGCKITESTLQPTKRYTVAVENYLAERAERFLGQTIEYTSIAKNTYQAMIEWFAEYETIKAITPRINRQIKD